MATETQHLRRSRSKQVATGTKLKHLQEYLQHPAHPFATEGRSRRMDL